METVIVSIICIALVVFGGMLGMVEGGSVGWSGGLGMRLALVALLSFLSFLLSLQAAASWGTMVRTALPSLSVKKHFLYCKKLIKIFI